MTNIKTIDIQAKEWFDKVNGNSYFSAQATINFGMPDEKVVYVPFQYGYGNEYETITFHQMKCDGLIKDQTIYSPYTYCNENNIILRSSKREGCLKRDVIAHGSN